MSRYDEISREASAAQKPIAVAYGICGCLCAFACWRWLPVHDPMLRLAGTLLSGVIGGGVVLLGLTEWIPGLKRQRNLVKSLHAQMEILAAATREFHDRMPSREKGSRFKDAHSLEGRTVSELEDFMSSGMLKEEKEV